MAHLFKIFTLVYLFCCPLINAQGLNAPDTSEKSVRRYRSIIRQNRQLVGLIEYTFTSRGVPKHLRNLAIIESGLNHNIESGAGAKGVWQLMTEHANHYGLSETDRSDMYKSTKTVVNSLINLYNKYGNWVTVVAAYNCGEGNIRKAMGAAGSKKYTEFSAYLPAETQNHVKKYLNACYATGELGQVLADYYKTPAPAVPRANRPPDKASPSPGRIKAGGTLRQTMLNSAFDLDAVAASLKTTKAQLLAWNPGIEARLRQNGESIFYLPRELMMEFEINKNKILNASLKK